MSERDNRTAPATLEELASSWKDNAYLDDDLHTFFERSGHMEWPDIADLCRRVSNAMFGEQVEDESPRDMVVTAAVAQSYYAALEAVALALGVDKTDLMLSVSLWAEATASAVPNPPPVGFTGLKAMCEEHAARRAEREGK